VLQRLKEAEHPGEEGLRLCQEMLREVAPYIGGIYVIPPFQRYQVVVDLLEGLPPGLAPQARSPHP